jgi:hypothetical protein
VYIKTVKDTLWARVFCNRFERNEIDLNLKKDIFFTTHSDGNVLLSFLNVDAIDCALLEFKPFR